MDAAHADKAEAGARRRSSIGIFFPAIRHLYGGERLVVETADELAREADVTLYTTFVAPEARPRRARVAAHGARWNRHGLQHMADWALMPLLARRARRHDVFLGMTYQGALGASLAARRHGVPWVYECLEPPRFLYDLQDLPTSTGTRIPGLRRLLRRLDRMAVLSAAAIVSISDSTARQVRAIYGRDSHIVYPGIETAPLRAISRQEARRRLGIGPEVRLYVSLSKLHPRKQIDKAIDLYREREAQNERAQLVVVGDGPERARLHAYAGAVATPPIRFAGFVSESDRIAWLRAADVFLFTARDEPFGLAPLEAKAAECEVIPTMPPYPVQSPAESVAQVRRILQEARGVAA